MRAAIKHNRLASGELLNFETSELKGSMRIYCPLGASSLSVFEDEKSNGSDEKPHNTDMTNTIATNFV